MCVLIVHPLERIEFLHGSPLQIEKNKVTILLFFVRNLSCLIQIIHIFDLNRVRGVVNHGQLYNVCRNYEGYLHMVVRKVGSAADTLILNVVYCSCSIYWFNTRK